jgi:prevent-host-death family protein
MPEAQELKEVAMTPGLGITIPVRAAKAKFSALLKWVAAGHEVVITRDGQPQAVLVPVSARRRARGFTGTIEQLRAWPQQTEGPWAEELVRADRESRGW